jgi:hypothetical protein
MHRSLALLTLDDALRLEHHDRQRTVPVLRKEVNRRPLAPSRACLPSRSPELAHPPHLLPGPI